MAPSILAADFARLGAQVQEVMDAGARVIHVDVMDGHFVPPISIGALVVDALHEQVHGAGGWLDVHLMVERPERRIEDFAKAGADSITVHLEATPHVHYALGAIREAGCVAGLALNPGTPFAADALEGAFDLLLCMTVNPGWGGQPYIPGSDKRIAGMREQLPEGVPIEVDGGIDAATAGPAAEAGATLFVAGSSVFGGARSRRGLPDTRPGHRRRLTTTGPQMGRIPAGGRRHREPIGRRLVHRKLTVLAVFAALLALPGVAYAGHGFMLDHPAQSFNTTTPPSPAFMSGGPGAKWDPIATFPTGNPHTDIDFFTRGGNTYVSAGTLGIGPNAGGQEIFQLTDGNRVAPKFVSAHPSASCISNPADATGLQHDVEAAPKGGAILNTDVLQADRSATQLLVDATDAPARCHDQGPLGLASPQGGLEIVDVTNPAAPKEIGLTSHIGEAHTVNIDPRRPHIAYAVTSDSVGVNAQGVRSNQSGSGLALDGFEMVDMSSCMNFAAGTTLKQKRDRCRPKVYRYRYPNTVMSLGHTDKSSVYGCHELEVYPDDRLTCAGGNAMILLDMKGVFDDNGTPTNFRDDKIKGTPLPCRARDSSSQPPFSTLDTQVIDCVDGTGAGTDDLNVPKWLAAGAPSVQGVRWLGSAFHQGRGAGGAATPAFDSTQDVDFNHESEFSNSGRYIFSTDERGGGILPPGASCSPGEDLKIGNGGIHAYDARKLLTRRPTSSTDAFSSYAKTSRGQRAIYRAPIRTRPQENICTSHVFQQIPGQNRIFMGWYSQGTQVVDFTENADGSIDFKEAGYFIPASADQWVSHIFKVERNANGSFTYYGVASDFALGSAGRNSVEVYKVTLPAPPTPRGRLAGTGAGFAPSTCLARRVRISRKGIGRLRLGQTRSRTARRARPLGNISRRTRVYRYCVKGDSKARGFAAFDKGGKRLRLAATNARRHKVRGLGRGNRTSSVRRKFRGRVRSLGRGRLLVRTKSGGVVFGSRKGKVTYVALLDRSVARSRRLSRNYLKLAKLR